MTMNLRTKARLWLMLLFMLPLGFYITLNHWGQSTPELEAGVLQALLQDYQRLNQQQLILATHNTRLNQPLPPEFSAYWQKTGESWQGSRRLPYLDDADCRPAPGGFFTQGTTHSVQLYLCVDEGSQQRLFLLQLSTLFNQPMAHPELRVGLVAPDKKLLLQPDPKKGVPAVAPIQAGSPLIQLLTQPSGFINDGEQDVAWLTTEYGWRLLLMQPHESLLHSGYSGMILIVTLLFCLLLSWFIPLWVKSFIYRRFAYLTKAAAKIALGDYSGHLPTEQQDELKLFHQVFNRMLDVIQHQKQQLREQNQQLQASNLTLKETLDTVQSMQSERFVTANNLLQNTELQILRQALKLPLQQLDEHYRMLLNHVKQLNELIHQTAMDRRLLREVSQECIPLFIEIESHMGQAKRLLQSNVTEKGELGEKQLFALQPLLQSSVQHLMAQGHAQEHHIYLRCPSTIELDSYPLALGQVINNLVSNSLRHGFKPGMSGEIIISAKQEGQQVILTYRDNGIGIDEQMQSKLFQPFFTADSANSGNSLGLYLTKQLVQKLLQGSIHYQPMESQGACFIITLPLGNVPIRDSAAV